MLPKLQVCSVSSIEALSAINTCRFHTLLIEDSQYISNVFDCLWKRGPYLMPSDGKYNNILDLELGDAFNHSHEPLDLSQFHSLQRLTLSSNERAFPFPWLRGQQIGLSSLVVKGRQIRLGNEFEKFVNRLLRDKLTRLSIRVSTFDYQPPRQTLSFPALHSLELAVDMRGRSFLRHNFPSLSKVSFSTCGSNEVTDFYEDFVGRLYGQLQDIVVQRRIPLGHHTALACLAGSLYEVLSDPAVDAILRCYQLRNFSLEGRVYFRLASWDRWCEYADTSNLQRAYFGRPNALVLAEDKYTVSFFLPARCCNKSLLCYRLH
jgi:hypothetical protein